MSTVNKIILIGRLGRDPEFRVTANGGSLATFSLATDRNTKNEQGVYEKTTDWHNVTVFNRQAEVAQRYLKQGKQVYIEGSLQYGKYTDKDGNERKSVNIYANVLQMLGSKDEGYADHTPQARPVTLESGWGEQNTPNRYQQAKDGTLPPQQTTQTRQAVGVQNMPDDIPF